MAPPEIQEATVADDGKAANLTFQVGPSSLEDRKVIVDEIRVNVAPGGELAPPEGITATPAGLAVVGVGLLDSLTSNRALLTWIALAGVAIWLLLRLTSLAKMAVVMLPVLLAVGLSSTLVYLLGLTVSPLTTVSGPLVIAICTEFATLILFRHLEERRQGFSPEESIDVAAAHTGRAFFASALTTVGGFAVMLFSPLPLLRDFGAIVAVTVAIALDLGDHRAAAGAGLGRQPRLGRPGPRPPPERPRTGHRRTRRGDRRRLTVSAARTGFRARAAVFPDPGLQGWLTPPVT